MIRLRHNPTPSCSYMIPRSPRHPIADLTCGAKAKFTSHGMPVCGVHAACLRRRGEPVLPIGDAR